MKTNIRLRTKPNRRRTNGNLYVYDIVCERPEDGYRSKYELSYCSSTPLIVGSLLELPELGPRKFRVLRETTIFENVRW